MIGLTKLRQAMLLLLFVTVLDGVWSANQDPKCLLPMEPGPCRMSLERYYFNSKTNACETFKFGGCRGNDNKFGFRQTCEDACLMRNAAPAATAAPAAPAIVVKST